MDSLTLTTTGKVHVSINQTIAGTYTLITSNNALEQGLLTSNPDTIFDIPNLTSGHSADFNYSTDGRSLELIIERQNNGGGGNSGGGGTAFGWGDQTQLGCLAAAGYPGGTGFPTLRYLYNTHETSQLVAQALQEMWRKNLGIPIELSSQEWKVYKVSMQRGDYHLIRSAWSGDYHDPNSFLELFTSHSEQNQTGWSDPAYDTAMRAAAQTNATDAPARLRHLQTAEQHLLDAMPIIPLAHNRNKFLIRPEVQGWHPNPLDIHPFKSVSLRPQDRPE